MCLSDETVYNCGYIPCKNVIAARQVCYKTKGKRQDKTIFMVEFPNQAAP